MGKASMIGIDLAKHVFQLHGAAADKTVLFRRRLRREKLLELPIRAMVPAHAATMCGVEGWTMQAAEIPGGTELIVSDAAAP